MSSRSAKQTPKRKKSTRPNGPANLSSVSLLSAPASVSTNGVRRGIQFSSLRVRGQEGCRISGTVPLCTIGASQTLGLGLMNRTGTRLANWILRPADGSTLCPQLGRFSSCFTRYRFTNIRFNYDPIGSTASAVRLAFAFCADPQHPLFTSITDAGFYNTLLTIPGSRAFSPWMGWSQSFIVDDNWKYVDLTASDVVAAANIRQEAYGIMACVADSDPGTNYTYGILSMTFSLELLDLTPLVTVPSGPTSLRSGEPEEKSNTSSLMADAAVVDRPQVGCDSTTASNSSLLSSLVRSAPVAMPARRT